MRKVDPDFEKNPIKFDQELMQSEIVYESGLQNSYKLEEDKKQDKKYDFFESKNMSSLQVENGFFEQHLQNSVNSVIVSEYELEALPIEDENALSKNMQGID